MLSWFFNWDVVPKKFWSLTSAVQRFEVVQQHCQAELGDTLVHCDESSGDAGMESSRTTRWYCHRQSLCLTMPVGYRYTFLVRAVLLAEIGSGVAEVGDCDACSNAIGLRTDAVVDAFKHADPEVSGAGETRATRWASAPSSAVSVDLRSPVNLGQGVTATRVGESNLSGSSTQRVQTVSASVPSPLCKPSISPVISPVQPDQPDAAQDGLVACEGLTDSTHIMGGDSLSLSLPRTPSSWRRRMAPKVDDWSPIADDTLERLSQALRTFEQSAGLSSQGSGTVAIEEGLPVSRGLELRSSPKGIGPSAMASVEPERGTESSSEQHPAPSDDSSESSFDEGDACKHAGLWIRGALGRVDAHTLRAAHGLPPEELATMRGFPTKFASLHVNEADCLENTAERCSL